VFEGTIERVAPILKEAARQARVEIIIENPDVILKPGMFVRVQIEYDRHDNAMLVPISALVKDNGGKSVFVADTVEMVVRRVPVELGIVNGKVAEVLNPPVTGYVVTIGQHLLEDGSEIILPSFFDPLSKTGKGPDKSPEKE